MQLHVPIKLKKLNVYTLQTCLTIQIVHPKGISIYYHMFTQFSEGGFICLFALSWMIRMALVIHSYFSDFKKDQGFNFFNCNEQRI